jgi:4-oxalocrotonate tautomerase
VPHVEITIAQGREPAQIRTMMHDVHAAVLGSVDTRPEHIRVVVHEVARAHWATGDVTLTELDAALSHIDVQAAEPDHQDAVPVSTHTEDEEPS